MRASQGTRHWKVLGFLGLDNDVRSLRRIWRFLDATMVVNFSYLNKNYRQSCEKRSQPDEHDHLPSLAEGAQVARFHRMNHRVVPAAFPKQRYTSHSLWNACRGATSFANTWHPSRAGSWSVYIQLLETPQNRPQSSCPCCRETSIGGPGLLDFRPQLAAGNDGEALDQFQDGYGQ